MIDLASAKGVGPVLATAIARIDPVAAAIDLALAMAIDRAVLAVVKVTDLDVLAATVPADRVARTETGRAVPVIVRVDRATMMAAPGAPATGQIDLAIVPTGPTVRIDRIEIPIGIAGRAGGTIAGETRTTTGATTGTITITSLSAIGGTAVRTGGSMTTSTTGVGPRGEP